MQTIFPILRYNDGRAAIRWLCATFGFVERFSVPDSGPLVRHAQLKLGSNIIMLGSVRGRSWYGQSANARILDSSSLRIGSGSGRAFRAGASGRRENHEPAEGYGLWLARL